MSTKAHNNSHDTRDMSPAEKQQVHINRMDRPPYSQPDTPFKPRHEGSCFCGAVKFQISRERPLEAKFCHCHGCQLLHGAPFQWAAIFHKDDVRFTAGREQLVYWSSSEVSQEYVLPCKVSCGTCRSPIMDEGRNMLLLFPTLVHFEDARQRRVFQPRRAMDVPDGLPKWTEHKDASELMPETVGEKRGAVDGEV
ncbi:hypothetical protein Q9L58_004903 [Maublancomyces gigas]|uniref:CENP-V/GFA domain-containing protein n=1 Tax=Discina gigas TaxID=1032678 RepID=A0ABR3GJK6_9PEZI